MFKIKKFSNQTYSLFVVCMFVKYMYVVLHRKGT